MSEAPNPLSKNAQKKAAKLQRLAVLKLERRAREKEAKKEKKRLRAEKRAAGELDDEDVVERRKRPKLVPQHRFGGRVVVDLAFDDKMTDKEIVSLTSQLAYTYSANRKTGHHFDLVYTSLSGRTLTRLEGQNADYKRWTKTQWWSEGYDRLWSTGAVEKEAVVYLTADSPDELSELKPTETYIIGGVVDRNRYKNLCQDKAVESGIRTARLPIGRYVASLPTRKVLTVNQVFEIMLKWVETRSWEDAFYEIIPKRKFQTVKTGAPASSSTAPVSRPEQEGGEEPEDQCNETDEEEEEQADENETE